MIQVPGSQTDKFKAAKEAGFLGVEMDSPGMNVEQTRQAIAESVRKTGRAIVVHEDSRSWGYGAEIAARIGDELFEYLDAPVRRIGALDTFVGYHPTLEDAILPQPATIVEALRELSRY